MRLIAITIGLCLGATVPAAAQAPQAARDLAYCERLYEMHDRYVVRIRPGGSAMRDGMADLAVDRCRHGRFAEGIPVLEAKLQAAKVPLPAR